MHHFICFLCFLFVSTSSCQLKAQHNSKMVLTGIVLDQDQKPVPFAQVYIKSSNSGTMTDSLGRFTLHISQVDCTVGVKAMGFQEYEKTLNLAANHYKLKIILNESAVALNEVNIVGESKVNRIGKTAYNVEAIDIKDYENGSNNVANVLNKVSGIKIKEVGGVGSSTQVTLNGFSGKHVRVFMDGIPVEESGSSLQLNNLPVNLADRIEVYKGVVPVELGADALGGAINIVTRNTKKMYLDASYSYGSFNTHKTNLNFGQTTKRGITWQLNLFQNYSDNSYKVKTKLLDLETNTYSDEEYWFKRFHDTYHSETGIVKVGLRDQKWATKLLFETTYSQEQAEVQNANLMKIVFGGRERFSKSIIPAIYYEKKDLFYEHLNLALSGKYNYVSSSNIDTMARQYNWKGEYRNKTTKGESEYSLSKYSTRSMFYNGNVNYMLNDRHYFSLNNVFNTYTRITADEVANDENSTEADFMERQSLKNISGLSYRFEPSEIWNLSLFDKYYWVNITGPIDTSSTTSSQYEQQSKTYSAMGYGLAATLKLGDNWQVKSSYERSYRLPSEKELFGDAIMETGDATLKAENSDNINLNLLHSYQKNELIINYNLGLIYRYTKDYIRRQIEQKYGGAYYTNHGKVLTLGADLEVGFTYKRRFMVNGNISYQSIRNKEKYSATGQKLIYYNDRMPNIPYLFSNVDAQYNWCHVFSDNDNLSLGYGFQYVYQFYRSWASEGGDIIIPTQLSHDLSLNYSFKNGRYNVALEAHNITDEILYDNYSLQKPGRSFSVKLRYYFFKI